MSWKSGVKNIVDSSSSGSSSGDDGEEDRNLLASSQSSEGIPSTAEKRKWLMPISLNHDSSSESSDSDSNGSTHITSSDSVDISTSNPILDFIQACASGNIESAELALNSGVSINSQGDMNLTGLHVATIGGHLKMVQWLVVRDASLSCRTSNGMTPLHFACEYKHTSISIYLIRMGADISLQNRHNLNPLHYICITNNLKLAPQIPQYMINSMARDSVSLLHCAADSGSYDMVKYLIEHGAEVSKHQTHIPTRQSGFNCRYRKGIQRG